MWVDNNTSSNNTAYLRKYVYGDHDVQKYARLNDTSSIRSENIILSSSFSFNDDCDEDNSYFDEEDLR